MRPAAATASAGWTPPPKPGLIPLRPLSFGTIIGSSFRVMRRNPGPTFGLSILLYGGVMVLYAVVLVGFVALLVDPHEHARSSKTRTPSMRALSACSRSASFCPSALAVVAAGILQGIISLEVSRATLGEKLRLRGLWRLAKGRIGALFGWSFLLLGGLRRRGSPSSVFSAVFVLAASLSTDPAAVIASIARRDGRRLPRLRRRHRARRLARHQALARADHHRARAPADPAVDGAVVVAHQGQLLAHLRHRAARRASSSARRRASCSFRSLLIFGIARLARSIRRATRGRDRQLRRDRRSSTWSSPSWSERSASSCSRRRSSLIYIDIRMRKEGLDLELMHFVEAKAAGTPGVENPYLATVGTGHERSAGRRGNRFAVGLAILTALPFDAVPFDVPVDPDAPEAKQLLADELAKAEYQTAKPSWFDLLMQAILDWINGLQVGQAQGPPAVGLLVVAHRRSSLLLRHRLPRLRAAAHQPAQRGHRRPLRRRRRAHAPRRSAAPPRAAAARGDYALAIAEMFRSIARGLAERTVLTTTPGNHGARLRAARRARLSRTAPSELAAAAAAFDDVRYLEQPGTSEQFDEVDALERALRDARAALDEVDA